jgi:hypothetical protein
METLAYLHCASAYDEAPPIEFVPGEENEPLFNSPDWKKLSSKACLALIPFAVAWGALGAPQQAHAGYHCGYRPKVVKCSYAKVKYHKVVKYKAKYIKVVRKVVIPDYKYVKIHHPVLVHKTKLVKSYHPVVIRKPVYRSYKVVRYHGCCKKVIIHKSKCFHKKVVYRPTYHYKHYAVWKHRVKYAKVYHPVVFHKVKYIKVFHPVVFYKPKYHHYHHYKVVHRPSCCKRFHVVHRPKHYSYHHYL